MAFGCAAAQQGHLRGGVKQHGRPESKRLFREGKGG